MQKPIINPINENIFDIEVIITLSFGLNQSLLKLTIEFINKNYDIPFKKLPSIVK